MSIVAGVIIILLAIALYVRDYLRTGNIINLRGLFSLSYLGGIGTACLKLSYLQTDWEFKTWLCFFLAFFTFYVLYEWLLLKKFEIKLPGWTAVDKSVDWNRFFVCIIVLTSVSLACFILEAAVLGYIPLFLRGVPHAYSYFHISGVHYFTVSCVLVPAMAAVWLLKADDRSKAKIIALAICSAAAFAIPLLCVSRFQFVFAVAMAASTYVAVKKTIPVKYAVGAAAAGIAAFAVLSIARSHDAEYLNSIFEMKVGLPVDISRVYIYIANNYENFNCMVRDLPEHTWGLRLLFPAWALTGLKFRFPQLAASPLFVTKEELTTLTMFYDWYYDFGVLGVIAGSAIIGAAAYFVETLNEQKNNPLLSLFYSQIAIYMALAFFTTWFSNPTTWFYLAVTAIVYFVSAC